MTVRLTIETDDGRTLATIDTAHVPRLDDYVQTVEGLHRVTAVIWGLTDSPLTHARIICSGPA